jgi:ABC-type uncharacterized transport system fused permease/ATPase subunit
LLKIVIPSYTCKESVYMLSLLFLLVARTIMSIWLADVNGNVVKAIVARDLNDFVRKVIILAVKLIRY